VAIVGGSSLGPGSPTPVQYNYQASSLGKPSLTYDAGSRRVVTTVALGPGDSRLAANFELRPPARTPGVNIGAQRGTFVDVNA